MNSAAVIGRQLRQQNRAPGPLAVPGRPRAPSHVNLGPYAPASASAGGVAVSGSGFSPLRVQAGGKQEQDDQDKRGLIGTYVSVGCVWRFAKALSPGVFLIAVGTAMCVVGFLAEQLATTTTTTTTVGDVVTVSPESVTATGDANSGSSPSNSAHGRGQHARSNEGLLNQNKQSGTTVDRTLEYHLHNLSFAGPAIMGLGGICIVAACVLTFGVKDHQQHHQQHRVVPVDEKRLSIGEALVPILPLPPKGRRRRKPNQPPMQSQANTVSSTVAESELVRPSAPTAPPELIVPIIAAAVTIDHQISNSACLLHNDAKHLSKENLLLTDTNDNLGLSFSYRKNNQTIRSSSNIPRQTSGVASTHTTSYEVQHQQSQDLQQTSNAYLKDVNVTNMTLGTAQKENTSSPFTKLSNDCTSVSRALVNKPQQECNQCGGSDRSRCKRELSGVINCSEVALNERSINFSFSTSSDIDNSLNNGKNTVIHNDVDRELVVFAETSGTRAVHEKTNENCKHSDRTDITCQHGSERASGILSTLATTLLAEESDRRGATISASSCFSEACPGKNNDLHMENSVCSSDCSFDSCCHHCDCSCHNEKAHVSVTTQSTSQTSTLANEPSFGSNQGAAIEKIEETCAPPPVPLKPATGSETAFLLQNKQQLEQSNQRDNNKCDCGSSNSSNATKSAAAAAPERDNTSTTRRQLLEGSSAPTTEDGNSKCSSCRRLQDGKPFCCSRSAKYTGSADIGAKSFDNDSVGSIGSSSNSSSSGDDGGRKKTEFLTTVGASTLTNCLTATTQTAAPTSALHESSGLALNRVDTGHHDGRWLTGHPEQRVELATVPTTATWCRETGLRSTAVTDPAQRTISAVLQPKPLVANMWTLESECLPTVTPKAEGTTSLADETKNKNFSFFLTKDELLCGHRLSLRTDCEPVQSPTKLSNTKKYSVIGNADYRKQKEENFKHDTTDAELGDFKKRRQDQIVQRVSHPVDDVTESRQASCGVFNNKVSSRESCNCRSVGSNFTSYVCSEGCRTNKSNGHAFDQGNHIACDANSFHQYVRGLLAPPSACSSEYVGQASSPPVDPSRALGSVLACNAVYGSSSNANKQRKCSSSKCNRSNNSAPISCLGIDHHPLHTRTGAVPPFKMRPAPSPLSSCTSSTCTSSFLLSPQYETTFVPSPTDTQIIDPDGCCDTPLSSLSAASTTPAHSPFAATTGVYCYNSNQCSVAYNKQNGSDNNTTMSRSASASSGLHHLDVYLKRLPASLRMQVSSRLFASMESDGLSSSVSASETDLQASGDSTNHTVSGEYRDDACDLALVGQNARAELVLHELTSASQPFSASRASLGGTHAKQTTSFGSASNTNDSASSSSVSSCAVKNTVNKSNLNSIGLDSEERQTSIGGITTPIDSKPGLRAVMKLCAAGPNVDFSSFSAQQANVDGQLTATRTVSGSNPGDAALTLGDSQCLTSSDRGDSIELPLSSPRRAVCSQDGPHRPPNCETAEHKRISQVPEARGCMINRPSDCKADRNLSESGATVVLPSSSYMQPTRSTAITQQRHQKCIVAPGGASSFDRRFPLLNQAAAGTSNTMLVTAGGLSCPNPRMFDPNDRELFPATHRPVASDTATLVDWPRDKQHGHSYYNDTLEKSSNIPNITPLRSIPAANAGPIATTDRSNCKSNCLVVDMNHATNTGDHVQRTKHSIAEADYRNELQSCNAEGRKESRYSIMDDAANTVRRQIGNSRESIVKSLPTSDPTNCDGRQPDSKTTRSHTDETVFRTSSQPFVKKQIVLSTNASNTSLSGSEVVDHEPVKTKIHRSTHGVIS